MLDPKEIIDFKSIEKCRNIKKEIMDFGVNEKEIIKLIELLSLELEDTVLMREIHNITNPTQEVEEEKEKLII